VNKKKQKNFLSLPSALQAAQPRMKFFCFFVFKQRRFPFLYQPLGWLPLPSLPQRDIARQLKTQTRHRTINRNAVHRVRITER
jgi:hypothetical protein